jgi:hypothetical protein
MSNKYRSNTSNLSHFTSRRRGKGWKPAKWNPEEDFPVTAFANVYYNI